MLTIRPTEVHPESTERDEDVFLRVAATEQRVALVRGLAGDIAARAEFDMDRIEDLRLAVEEACAVLIEQSVPGAVLDCRFRIAPDRIGLRLRSATDNAAGPDRDTFGWHVLETLSDSVRLMVDPPTVESAASTLELELGVRRRPLHGQDGRPTADEFDPARVSESSTVVDAMAARAVGGDDERENPITERIENAPSGANGTVVPAPMAGSEQ
ncbi:ATP-binding protein [Actinoalloteichus hymeniacidonis]|uniref:Anti-sigma regulatory factor (Ser/Thr protein kinase) n=1 Tax=Actinoalloteichus hymeniacidonis TaxID=340345 RepID=A0AAC9HPN6_9PSEU|nr:hypothetical protein [Actinoalloteichus hymeniacidonis]AOS63023.1 anti-sigma regulatory factor (Ser/Thr protein kinase) [Actinoalloteichus hymeniacidonis]MBB5908942.1 hypothetical protein [Actinoalloteichus hymeniacidonis]